MNVRIKTKSIMSINSGLKAAQKFSDCRRVMIIETKIRHLNRIFFTTYIYQMVMDGRNYDTLFCLLF